MLFGLTNVLAVFMDLMNRVLRKFLYLFVIVFIAKRIMPITSKFYCRILTIEGCTRNFLIVSYG